MRFTESHATQLRPPSSVPTRSHDIVPSFGRKKWNTEANRLSHLILSGGHASFAPVPRNGEPRWSASALSSPRGSGDGEGGRRWVLKFPTVQSDTYLETLRQARI